MDNLNQAVKCAKVLSEKKAENVLLLDIGEQSSFADYMIIGTSSSERHTLALCDHLEDVLAEDGIMPKSIEGRLTGDWVLMDYGDIIINIFTEESREKYNIEKIWSDCKFIEIEEN